MDRIKVTRATIGEIQQLQKIGKQTFIETFSAENTEANMQRYLDEGFSTEKITKELNETHSYFYFALLEEQIIGYLKVNTSAAQTEKQDNNTLEIERIYVSQEFQGKKVGQILYNKALDIAYKIKAPYIWLGVWEKNPRAINFYKKNGFIEFDKHIFKLGSDEQTDIMMKKLLISSL